MKKLLITIVGAQTLGATLPVFAGSEFQVIERARKAKHLTRAARYRDTYETVAGPLKCVPDALVRPLDYGPRAQTTPYQNQLRKDRYEAQVTACKEAAK